MVGVKTLYYHTSEVTWQESTTGCSADTEPATFTSRDEFNVVACEYQKVALVGECNVTNVRTYVVVVQYYYKVSQKLEIKKWNLYWSKKSKRTRKCFTSGPTCWPQSSHLKGAPWIFGCRDLIYIRYF